MERKIRWRSSSPASAQEPCRGCGFRARCRTGEACDRFVYFVETGNAHGASGARVPSRHLFGRLFPEDALKALRMQWRDEGRELANAALRGERPAMPRAEHRRRWRQHEKTLWRLDPERREKHLAYKRAAAMRRERARGRQPITFEIAAARSRLGWQRRRATAAEAGLIMRASEVRELRTELGMTQRELGAAIGRRRTAIEHWECGENQAPPAAVRQLRQLRTIAEGKVPAPSIEAHGAGGGGFLPALALAPLAQSGEHNPGRGLQPGQVPTAPPKP